MRIYRIRKFPAKLLILLIIAIIILNPKISSSFKNKALDILAKPFSFITHSKEAFSRGRDISEENLLLKQRLSAISVELARMRETERENDRLHSLLDFKKKLRYNTIASRVIARDASDFRKSVIIDKGKSDGIREGMACAASGFFIGRISEASVSTSKVILITDPNSRVGVMLESSRETGVLIGSPEGTCKVLYLSIDEQIGKGEKVVTAGFGESMPKNLSVGEVISVGVDNANLYKYAIIKPFGDMNKIEEVICIDAGS